MDPILTASLARGLGSAIPYLASAIFGNIGKRDERALQRTQNEMLQFQLQNARRRQPAKEALISSLLGRLPTHMKAGFPRNFGPNFYGPEGNLLFAPARNVPSGRRNPNPAR